MKIFLPRGIPQFWVTDFKFWNIYIRLLFEEDPRHWLQHVDSLRQKSSYTAIPVKQLLTKK
jgi:hypothetical protein